MSARVKLRINPVDWAEAQNPTTPSGPPGTPSEYIKWAQDLPLGTRVVLYHRVSSVMEYVNGSMHRGAAELRRWAEDRGFIIVGEVFAAVESGRMTSDWEQRQDWLLGQAAAQDRDLDAYLLALHTDRFARPRNYDHRNQAATGRLSDVDLQRLVQYVRCRLATVNDPDSTFSDTRSQQTRRGQAHSDSKPGRPTKVNRGGRPTTDLAQRWASEYVGLLLDMKRENPKLSSRAAVVKLPTIEGLPKPSYKTVCHLWKVHL